MANVFSLAGKGLILDSEKDFQPYAEQIAVIDTIKEVNIMGNTFGIGASQALGRSLKGLSELETVNSQICLLEGFEKKFRIRSMQF